MKHDRLLKLFYEAQSAGFEGTREEFKEAMAHDPITDTEKQSYREAIDTGLFKGTFYEYREWLKGKKE